MPQTKPMMWTKFLITMNLLSMILLLKLFQWTNKKKNPLMILNKFPMTKW